MLAEEWFSYFLHKWFFPNHHYYIRCSIVHSTDRYKNGIVYHRLTSLESGVIMKDEICKYIIDKEFASEGFGAERIRAAEQGHWRLKGIISGYVLSIIIY